MIFYSYKMNSQFLQGYVLTWMNDMKYEDEERWMKLNKEIQCFPLLTFFSFLCVS